MRRQGVRCGTAHVRGCRPIAQGSPASTPAPHGPPRLALRSPWVPALTLALVLPRPSPQGQLWPWGWPRGVSGRGSAPRPGSDPVPCPALGSSRGHGVGREWLRGCVPGAWAWDLGPPSDCRAGATPCASTRGLPPVVLPLGLGTRRRRSGRCITHRQQPTATPRD